MENSDLERQIIDLVLVHGYGRPTIQEMIGEDVSEWFIRKAIRKAKKLAKETDNVQGQKNLTNKEVVADLKTVKVVSPKAPKPDPKNTSGLFTVAFVGDTHGHWVDERAFSTACKIIADTKIDVLVHLGDLVDFYSISRFDKDPNRRLTVQDEINVGAVHLDVLSQCVSDKTRKIFVKGNHERRLDDYIKKNAPALYDMDMLKLPNLLNLKESGWEYVDHDLELVEGFLIKHGERVSGHSAYTAKAELSSAWMSGISGHVHRLGVHEFYSRRDFIKNKPPTLWVENGCLCTLDPEYVNGNPNWQHGFTIMQFCKDGTIVPTLVHIFNGKAVYNGKVYTS